MAPEAFDARELTRRLIAREAKRRGVPERGVDAVRGACERARIELSRWVGTDGAHLLLTRTLNEVRFTHPSLKDVRIDGSAGASFDGIIASVEAHGERAVAAALFDVLETLIGLLGRLIGDDLVATLMAPGEQFEAHDNQNPS